eukprot:TRINITY_DN67265_c5_g2_i1.p1 TRINITY_DN67265_c5_g2~~TRINITY_DN67265_c5_g2_i1.p1  ORF type:complete len:439 (+),score=60.70 TRINITY_DN67265_c5_g2_i1:57-1319(+)
MRTFLLLVAAIGALALQGPPADLFTVHEWGTHTAMQGSNGIGMSGLEHEEEGLPHFVKARASDLLEMPDIHYNPANYPHNQNYNKGGDWEPTDGALEVTQKLETPVLYFYSPKAVNVQVDVKFPHGIVTEVYPNMTDFSPPLHQVEEVANGYAQWKVHVHEPTTVLDVPQVETDSIWAPSRRVQANMLSYKNETEHLIFYRGLGQWQGQLQVTSDYNTLTVNNHGHETVPAVFLIETTTGGGAIRSLGHVQAGGSLSTPIRGEHIGDRMLPMDLHETRCQVLLEAALMEAGLFPLEARAMVETWTRSYFKSSGIRVLYVLPRTWTDEILPIHITPKPDALERVLVGRVEVLPFAQEKRLADELAMLPAKISADELNVAFEHMGVPSLGRFADSKLRRAAQVADKPHLRELIDSYIAGLEQ